MLPFSTLSDLPLLGFLFISSHHLCSFFFEINSEILLSFESPSPHCPFRGPQHLPCSPHPLEPPLSPFNEKILKRQPHLLKSQPSETGCFGFLGFILKDDSSLWRLRDPQPPLRDFLRTPPFSFQQPSPSFSRLRASSLKNPFPYTSDP